jgi:glycosyltransferase involved in cell wall biosynthesis
VTKRLEKVLPAPLRPPIRAAAFLLIPPLRRRLRRTWRRRNRLKRRVRGTGDRLKRLRRRLERFLSDVWRRELKQRIWLAVWRIHIWRRGDRPLEYNNQIHLISSLWRLHTGSALRTLHLFDELKDHADVYLWTERPSVPQEIRKKYPVKRIVPERFEFPKTGTFVFVGSFPPIGPWHRYTYPRRVVLVHNSDKATARRFRRKLRQLSKGGRREVEVVYASELSKRSAGNHPGFVQASLIDLDRFVPSASKPSNSASAGFTVGRLSMGTPRKHHPDDPALYRQLVNHGCRVRIMGPSQQLEAKLRGLESIELLPGYAQEAHLFLQGLDCFFYRTSENYLEPSGRVITEAMACGLPVVCHNRGGYVEWIEDGRNGFLFDTQQEALEILLKLKEEPALRERVGKEARRTAEELFSDAVRSEIVEFYLR